MADIVALGRYRGDYVAGTTYAVGDVVRLEGKYYFTFSAVTNASNPGLDRAHFDLLPLVETGEKTIVDDDFETNPGPVAGRKTGDATWYTTGPGAASATVQGGYASSADNVYYMLSGFAGSVTEFTSYAVANKADTSAGIDFVNTLSLLQAPYDGQLDRMWHANWYDSYVGDIRIYNKAQGRVGVFPTLKYSYVAGLRLTPFVEEKMTLLIRGNFVIGYLNDRLAFVHLSDDAGLLANNPRTVYIQNHSATFGVERQTRVVLKAVP